VRERGAGLVVAALCAGAGALGLLSAQQSAPPCCTEASAAALPPLPPGATSKERWLRRIHDEAAADGRNGFLSTRYIGDLLDRLARLPAEAHVAEQFVVRRSLALALVRTGDIPGAIELYEQCLALCAKRVVARLAGCCGWLGSGDVGSNDRDMVALQEGPSADKIRPPSEVSNVDFNVPEVAPSQLVPVKEPDELEPHVRCHHLSDRIIPVSASWGRAVDHDRHAGFEPWHHLEGMYRVGVRIAHLR
jgi:hypothetical protein